MPIIHLYKSHLSDSMLKLCFNRMIISGKFELAFYDGKLDKSPIDFIDFVRDKSVHFWEHHYIDENKKDYPLGFNWLNGLESGDENGGVANIHFCSYNFVHIYDHLVASPIVQLRATRSIVAHILYDKLSDRYTTQEIYGTVPISNDKAMKWMELVANNKPLCILPKRCYIAALNKNVDAAIYCMNRNNIHSDWRK